MLNHDSSVVLNAILSDHVITHIRAVDTSASPAPEETQVWTEDPKKEPGNFGDPVGLGMYDVDMRNKELNNGRLAMFTAIGLILAELVSGKSGFGQFS